MAYAHGGKVEEVVKERVIDTRQLEISVKGVLFSGLSDTQTVWVEQNESITEVPNGFIVTASTPESKIAAIENAEKNFYGVQFHPEVKKTINGQKMIENFIKRVCELKK